MISHDFPLYIQLLVYHDYPHDYLPRFFGTSSPLSPKSRSQDSSQADSESRGIQQLDEGYYGTIWLFNIAMENHHFK